MKEKGTILMFPFALLLGSTHPLVAVGEELKKRGYRVIFASKGKYLDYIKKAGFETEEICDLDMSWFTKNVDRGRMAYHDSQSLQIFVNEELKLIKKIKPDLIIDIHRPSLKITSKILGVPKVSIVDAIFTTYYRGKKSMPETHWLSVFNNTRLTKQLNEKLLPYAEAFYYRLWSKPYDKLLKRYKLKPIKNIKHTLEGDTTIFMDSREFAPTRKFNENVFFVGPVLHTHNEHVPEWYKHFNSKKKTIFLSMGSSGVLFPKVLRYLVDMFKNSDEYQVVATTALNHSIPEIEYPKNFYLTDYIPADLILSKNCSLMITHGGRGSIYHALSYGVPMIGLPHQAEQEWNLDRVEELKLGHKLSSKKLDYKTFSKAVNDLLENDSYRENARLFEESLKAYQGSFAAANVVDMIMRDIRMAKTGLK
jgi:MGT family glycosyltransferase